MDTSPDNKPSKSEPVEPKIIKPSVGKELVVSSFEHYEGAIPHPALMERWEKLVPGSAKDMFKEFKSQSTHRRESETKVIAAHNFKLYVGPVFGFIISMTAIGGGIWIALVTAPVVGGLLSFTGLASLVAPFVVNETRRSSKQKQDEKE